uniref:Uncharacterized protein n=1 Tax=Anguilla anguilla TaxID=7936 RepID=A0A0E9T438_ANGAN
MNNVSTGSLKIMTNYTTD